MAEVMKDSRFEEVRDNIIKFCDKNNRIPSIVEYNQYVGLSSKVLNKFLLDNNISHSYLIEMIIGLKQISIRRTTEVYGIKPLLTYYKSKVESYMEKYNKLPDFDTIKSFHEIIDDIRFRKLFGNSYTKFLKQIGVKYNRKVYRKMYSFNSYSKTTEDVIRDIIKLNNGADIVVRSKSGAVKISIKA